MYNLPQILSIDLLKHDASNLLKYISRGNFTMRFCKTSFQFLQVFLIQWRLIISLTQILFPKYNLHNMVKTVSVVPSEVLQATKLWWINLVVVQNGTFQWNCTAFASRAPCQFDQQHSLLDSTSISWSITVLCLNRLYFSIGRCNG